MASVHLSLRAEADLLNIGAYTLYTWGPAQAPRYLGQIKKCCGRLAENPSLGRASEDLGEGLRRIEQGSHVIFYRKVPEGILVSRILHRSMLPVRHAMDEE